MDNLCYSIVGKQGGKQFINLGTNCDYIDIVQHEILHSLGFGHTHARSDKYDHIIIDLKNVKANMVPSLNSTDNNEMNNLVRIYF